MYLQTLTFIIISIVTLTFCVPLNKAVNRLLWAKFYDMRDSRFAHLHFKNLPVASLSEYFMKSRASLVMHNSAPVHRRCSANSSWICITQYSTKKSFSFLFRFIFTFSLSTFLKNYSRSLGSLDDSFDRSSRVRRGL